jgi:hypothetical protein
MWLLKNRSRGIYLCFVLLLVMVVGGSAIAYADSGKAKVAVKGGSLTESNATNQVSLSVSKNMQLAKYSLPITVTDARGSGSGWKLSITSTQFLSSNNKGDQLPSNASQITGVSRSCSVHSTCTLPINSVSYPLLVPADTKPPSPVKFFNAAVSSGLGVFGLTMMVNVTIPASAKAGTYTSTIFIAVANGP